MFVVSLFNLSRARILVQVMIYRRLLIGRDNHMHMIYSEEDGNNPQGQQTQMTSILSNLNNFYSLEVVDRVSETQLQVGENRMIDHHERSNI